MADTPTPEPEISITDYTNRLKARKTALLVTITEQEAVKLQAERKITAARAEVRTITRIVSASTPRPRKKKAAE